MTHIFNAWAIFTRGLRGKKKSTATGENKSQQYHSEIEEQLGHSLSLVNFQNGLLQEEERKEEGLLGLSFRAGEVMNLKANSELQKPKLKVGKTKAKAANFTDTSFKSKG